MWDVNPVLHAQGLSPQKTHSAFPNIPPGWLCFECADERRRLSPIPPDWISCDPAVLAELCDRAVTVRGGRDSASA